MFEGFGLSEKTLNPCIFRHRAVMKYDKVYLEKQGQGTSFIRLLLVFWRIPEGKAMIGAKPSFRSEQNPNLLPD